MTNEKEINFKGLYIILLIACLITALIIMKHCKKIDTLQQINTIYSHLDDSLKYYKNKYGEATTQISLLQGNSVDLILSIKSKDKTIQWLQQEVNKYKGNVSNGGTIGVIGTSTTFSATTASTIELSPVMNTKFDSFPTYNTTNKDTTWIKYYIAANKDSTNFKLEVKNKYTIVIGEEKVKGHLFKKNPIAFITNLNPYTSITDLKVYQVTNKVNKRISLGIGGGYCIPLFTFKPEPYIGVGIHYNIINLW
jgi:hypothetical protein